MDDFRKASLKMAVINFNQNWEDSFLQQKGFIFTWKKDDFESGNLERERGHRQKFCSLFFVEIFDRMRHFQEQRSRQRYYLADHKSRTFITFQNNTLFAAIFKPRKNIGDRGSQLKVKKELSGFVHSHFLFSSCEWAFYSSISGCLNSMKKE